MENPPDLAQAALDAALKEVELVRASAKTWAWCAEFWMHRHDGLLAFLRADPERLAAFHTWSLAERAGDNAPSRVPPHSPSDLDLAKVTRVEVIDHDPKLGDAVGVVWRKQPAQAVMVSLQDEERTLKVFVR